MGLTRWSPITPQGKDYAVCIIDPQGDFYDAADVDAMFARIWAALEKERGEVECVFSDNSVPDQRSTLGRWWDAQCDLEELLKEVTDG